MRALFKSHNLIGDALYIGPALRAWIKQHPEYDEIFIHTLPDHVAPLYQGMVRDLIKITTISSPLPLTGCDFEFTFDVSQAFQLCDKNKYHLAEGYAEMLGVTLEGEGDQRLKPIYIPDYSEKWEPTFEGILVSMFSASCTSHDPKCNYIPNKCLPLEKWAPVLAQLRKTFPNTPIKALGAPTDVLSETLKETYKIDPMFGIPLNDLALFMQKAKLLVTIDNGMSHLAASQETPTCLFYPRCLSPTYILPKGNPNLVYVHMEPNRVNPEQLVHTLKFAVDKFCRKEAA